MAKIIGLTGGIGSGKTTIANYFKEMGVPVYIADDRAKEIMQSQSIIKEIKALFGEAIFENEVLNRARLADIVFNNADKLNQLNAIIHPAVKKDFELWLQKNKDYDYVIYEAAILFESGSYKECDVVITVTAPEEIKIERVIKRDKASKKQVLERMNMQWNDEKRIPMSNFIIFNDTHENARREVVKILKILNIKQNHS